MAPILHGKNTSSCTLRCLMTFEEKSVQDYKLVTVNLAEKEHKTPEYLAKQPFGVIPYLEDDDSLIMFESRAIMRYIAEKYAGQGTDLLGETLEERARVTQWLEVESQNYNPAISALMAAKSSKGSAEPAVVEELKAKFEKVLDVYEQHLTGRDYLANNKFSIADLSHLTKTVKFFGRGLDDCIYSRPNVAKWWERISSRPAWKKLTA